LRCPLDSLVRDLSEVGGLSVGVVHLVGETTLRHLKTRPDYGVIVNNALVGRGLVLNCSESQLSLHFRTSRWIRGLAGPNLPRPHA
jgi:hypothetical protein